MNLDEFIEVEQIKFLKVPSVQMKQVNKRMLHTFDVKADGNQMTCRKTALQ